MSKERYLTKSRFKEGLECPTKLYYSKNNNYQNNQLEDPFGIPCRGGYQIGELAKFLISDQPYLDKITIESLDYEDSLELTKKKLINDYVSVAESAFLYKTFLSELIY